MTSFLKLRTYGENEIYEYDPTTLGKLSSFTLSMKKFNDQLFDFGQDKIHIKKVEKYLNKREYLNEKYKDTLETLDDDDNPSITYPEEIDAGCYSKNRNYYKITVLCEHPDYQEIVCSDNKNISVIEGHGLSPGDLIYIYNTNTCNLQNKIRFNLDKIDYSFKLISPSEDSSEDETDNTELSITVLINADKFNVSNENR